MKAGLLCVALALCCGLAAGDLVEIDSSILVSGPSDYDVSGGTSRCIQMVDRAKALTQTSIMFVPTLFWVNENAASLSSVNQQSNVSYFCYERTYGGDCGSPSCCSPATTEEMQNFQSSMAQCIGAAVSAGLNVAVSPHLDDGLGYGGWRNGLLLNPVENYGGMTYQDFMLNPLADAINSVITDNTQVDFAMQGEMSATVMYYPEEYINLLPTMQARITAGRPSSYADNVRVGVSLNFDKLCACVLQDLVDPSQYLSLYPAAFAPLKSEFNLPAISSLFDAVDFIGISSYPSLSPSFTVNQIESATYQFATEIASFGVNITDLIFNKGKKLYWNEYGVGGGTSQNGDVKATTAAEAAEYPFFGVFGQYTKANDPWQLYDVNSPPPTLDYLHYFYNQTIAYLNSGGAPNQAACPGCQYRIDGVYLWNSASWDIQAIYPESTSTEGSYLDPTLKALFNAHNAAVAGTVSSPTPTPSSSPPASPSSSPSTPGVVTGAGSSVGTGIASNTAGRKLSSA